MNFLFLLSPNAIGPVWPAMLLYLTYMAATSLFLVLAWLRSYFNSFTLRELRFLQRIYDATEMVSTLAILTGMIGTCVGLLDVLPALGDGLRTNATDSILPNVLSPLRHVWVSTVTGLALGGLWGEILMFILKPYTRPALLPISNSEPPKGEPLFEELEPLDNDQGGNENIDDDWRQHDVTGTY